MQKITYLLGTAALACWAACTPSSTTHSDADEILGLLDENTARTDLSANLSAQELNSDWQNAGYATPAHEVVFALQLSVAPAQSLNSDQDRIWLHAQTGTAVTEPMSLFSSFLTEAQIAGLYLPVWAPQPNPGVADPKSLVAATVRSSGVAANGAPVATFFKNGSAGIQTCCFSLFGSSPSWLGYGSYPAALTPTLFELSGEDLFQWFTRRNVDAAYRWTGDVSTSNVFIAFEDAAHGNRPTVIRRTNAGAWQTLGAPGIGSDAFTSLRLYAPPTQDPAGRVYLATLSQNGATVRVYRSNSASWTQVGPALSVPDPSAATLQPLDLAVHEGPSGQTTFFVLTAKTLHSITSAAGATWRLEKTLSEESCSSVETAAGTLTAPVFLGCLDSPADGDSQRAIVLAGYKSSANGAYAWYNLGGLDAPPSVLAGFVTDLAYAPKNGALYFAFSRPASGGQHRVQILRKSDAEEYCYSGSWGGIVCIGG